MNKLTKRAKEIKETLSLPPINKGDTLLGGRFKNVPMEVKDVKKDKNNQPVLETSKGDRKAFPFRLKKLMNDIN